MDKKTGRQAGRQAGRQVYRHTGIYIYICVYLYYMLLLLVGGIPNTRLSVSERLGLMSGRLWNKGIKVPPLPQTDKAAALRRASPGSKALDKVLMYWGLLHVHKGLLGGCLKLLS